MNLWPGVDRIEAEFNGSALCMVILRGSDRTLLIDTGIPDTPKGTIFPYLHAIGVDPASINDVVITHASADHFGGLAAITRAAPGVRVIAHRLDVGSTTSVEHHLAENFTAAAVLGYPWSPAVFTITRALFGPPQRVTWAVEGGEHIDLGSGWIVTLLHTPGHTPGHISVWDPRHEAVYVGDAVLGRGVVSLAGQLASPPPYFDVADYRGSIETIRAHAPRALLATHYPVMTGGEVTDFLDASAAFADLCDETLLALFDASPSLSYAQAVAGLETRIGPPGEVWRMTALAHLNHLTGRGLIARVTSSLPYWTRVQEMKAAL